MELNLRVVDFECIRDKEGKDRLVAFGRYAGIAGAYKPQSVGNRMEGLANDFVNENIELVRKLSFVLQLSDPDDYEGGNLQLLDEAGNSYIAPRQRGTVILFDSRTQHRVQKVRTGVRKSLVGWTVGPRWK